jgi:hypothetical protein
MAQWEILRLREEEQKFCRSNEVFTSGSMCSRASSRQAGWNEHDRWSAPRSLRRPG